MTSSDTLSKLKQIYQTIPKRKRKRKRKKGTQNFVESDSAPSWEELQVQKDIQAVHRVVHHTLDLQHKLQDIR